MQDMTQSHDWTFPIPVLFGPGRLAELGAICQSNGIKRPLIVTDRASRDLPFVQAAQDAVAAAGLSSDVFSEVSPNPTDHDAATGLQVYRQGAHDAVIALGGGSGMDAGKAISLLAGSSERGLWVYDYDTDVDESLKASDFPPLICIPTTAGTGAETESTAMVTDTQAYIKRCVWHPTHKPLAALLDPAVTVGLPRNLTAWTGCDAMVHAIEAYSIRDFHPLCDGMALEGLRLVYRWLPEALADPTSLQARGGMLAGSCLAGISFLKGLGLVHSISHMVGAEYNTQHGLTNAVILPVVLRYNAPSITDKIGPMSQAMGLETTDFNSFHDAICQRLDDCDIPRSLVDLGVEESAIDRLAEKAHGDAATGTNPRASTPEDIAKLIREAMAGAR